MASIGEWLREKVGMSTKEEIEKRGEQYKGSKRDQQIESEVDKSTSLRDAPSGKFTNGKNGVDAGEAGPKWKDTFK